MNKQMENTTEEGTTPSFGRRKTSVWYTAGGAQNVSGPRQTRQEDNIYKGKKNNTKLTLISKKNNTTFRQHCVFYCASDILFLGSRCQPAHKADHSRSSKAIRRVKTSPKDN